MGCLKGSSGSGSWNRRSCVHDFEISETASPVSLEPHDTARPQSRGSKQPKVGPMYILEAPKHVSCLYLKFQGNRRDETQDDRGSRAVSSQQGMCGCRSIHGPWTPNPSL